MPTLPAMRTVASSLARVMGPEAVTRPRGSASIRIVTAMGVTRRATFMMDRRIVVVFMIDPDVSLRGIHTIPT